MSHAEEEERDATKGVQEDEAEPAMLCKILLNQVVDRWGEVKAACLPGVPVGNIADEDELLVLKRLIVERTHVRMVRSDDPPGVPRIYLPGTNLPFTPVESPLNPLRRLLEAADSAPRQRDIQPDGREARGSSSEVDPFRQLQPALDVDSSSALANAAGPAQCQCQPKNCCIRMLPLLTQLVMQQRETITKLGEISDRLIARGIDRADRAHAA